MSSGTKILALLLPFAALLGVLWVVIGRDDVRAVRAESADLVARPDAATGSSVPAAMKNAGAGAAGGATAERATVALPASAAVPPPAATWEEGFEATAVYATVVDDKARPIEGARVFLWEPGEEYEDLGPPLQEGTTNADGRFRFQGLVEFEEYLVYADAPGRLPYLGTRRTGVDDDIELVPSSSFAGRVLDAGSKQPLADVEVSVSTELYTEEGTLEENIRSTTGEDGRYVISHARLDAVQRVTVRRAGGMAETREFQVHASKPDGYDIELEPQSDVTVRVFDLHTGRPLADQELQIARGVDVTTDAQGLARLSAPAAERLRNGKLYFDVRLDGHCRTTRSVEVPAAGFRKPIDLPVFRGARVVGTVTAEDAGPLEGASMSLRGSNRRLSDYELPPGTSVRSNYGRVETDANGRFELRGILPGDREIRVAARHDDHPYKSSDPFYLPVVDSEQEVTLELGPGVTIEGVVTLNGEPILARVWWRNDDSNGQGVSNDSGAYRIRGVRPGLVTLGANVLEGGWNNDDHTEDLRVAAGEVVRHDIKILKNRATISGVVRDAAGQPAASIQVTGWAEDEGRNDWHYANDETDVDGRFELAVDDTPGMLWNLWASDSGRNVNKPDVPVGASNVELVLPRTGTLRLEVVDAVTRAPIQGFNVYYRERDTDDSFRSLSQGGREFSPGPDGVYEAELPVGLLDLRVSARSKGYVPAELPNVQVDEGVAGPPALVPLSKGVTVEITFTRVAGDANLPRLTLVTDAQLGELANSRWNDYAGREIHSAQRAQPDRDGKAVLKAMPPGTYKLYRAPKNYVFEPDTFVIPPVDHHTLEVRWRFEEPPEVAPAEASTINFLDGIGYFGDG